MYHAFFGIVVCDGDNDNDNDDNHNIVMMIIFPPWTWDPCFSRWSTSWYSICLQPMWSPLPCDDDDDDFSIDPCHHHCQHRHHNPHHRTSPSSSSMEFSQLSITGVDTVAAFLRIMFTFSACVYISVYFLWLCLWHRKMSLTQKDGFDTERCLSHRKMSLTQKDVVDTEWYLWHRKMSLT